MSSKELKLKVNGAEEKLLKIKNTLERHKKQADKKLEVILKNGWNEHDEYQKEGTNEHNECYWLVVDYHSKLEDIKNTEKKIKEAEKIVLNWKEKLDKELKKELFIETELPEILLELKEDLKNDWTNEDEAMKEKMFKDKNKMEFKEFRLVYSYSLEDYLNKSRKDFLRINDKLAKNFVLDLYNRIKHITGEVINWKNVEYGGKALNGFVYGKNGNAKVETIVAGGWNIQREHLRVLVHKI